MTVETEHRSAASFDLDNQWWQPCTCGENFSGSSPSAAYKKWKTHVEQVSTTGFAPDTAPPARARVCGCGCDEPLAPRAGGLFRSGHDARFKSKLAVAHASGVEIRHPLTGKADKPLTVASWLDERRGGGTFWYDKVSAGHKPKPERTPRARSQAPADAKFAASLAKVDKIMDFQATRRPTSGDMGMVTLRSGQFGARVVRRRDEDNLEVRLLDGQARGQEIVIPDAKFQKAAKPR